MRSALSMLALGFVLAGVAAPAAAEACSCMRPDLTRSYFQYSDTFAVKILGERVEGEYRYYRARVLKAFSGCTERGDFITIETRASSAACGLTLGEGERYLLTALGDDTRNAADTYSVGLCGYNVELTSLTQSDRDFLLDRQVVCDDTTTCADGSQPVACLADPCEVAQSCPEAQTCLSNYCGDCEAELYDASWAPVCGTE